mmetsp:Transcript_119637/g.338684  ORF Transcript_119637/g.338684 Transcript_119637/m.338684 type:complete len:243 (-) Transcript_119637:1025-1753(-)
MVAELSCDMETLSAIEPLPHDSLPSSLVGDCSAGSPKKAPPFQASCWARLRHHLANSSRVDQGVASPRFKPRNPTQVRERMRNSLGCKTSMRRAASARSASTAMDVADEAPQGGVALGRLRKRRRSAEFSRSLMRPSNSRPIAGQMSVCMASPRFTQETARLASDCPENSLKRGLTHGNATTKKSVTCAGSVANVTGDFWSCNDSVLWPKHFAVARATEASSWALKVGMSIVHLGKKARRAS